VVTASVQAALGHVAVSRELGALVGAGHQRVVAQAMVAGAAGFEPAVLSAVLQRQAASTTVTVARALGPHPLLVALAADRVREALGQWSVTDTAVLVVGRGSTDPESNAELVKVARLLQEGRELGLVEVAFLRRSGPDVATGLARCAALGAARVVVAPYVLLDPVFTAQVATAARAAGAGLPVAGAGLPVAGAGLPVAVAGHLNDSVQLTALVVERYHEALHGDLRMNCDVCGYRELRPEGMAGSV